MTLLEAGEELERAIDTLTDRYAQYRAMGLSHEAGTMIRLTAERVVSWSFS